MKLLSRLCMALALVAGVVAMGYAETWDVTADFVASQTNPVHDWTFGVYLEDAYNATATGPFYAWTALEQYPGVTDLMYFGNPGGDLNASVVFDNVGATPIAFGNQFWLPNQICPHPGALFRAYAPVIRWTAPRDMIVAIDALFTGQDGTEAKWTTTDVHVLFNGDMDNGPVYTGSLFDGNINGNVGNVGLGIAGGGAAPSQAYNGTISVVAGDTIDFVVNFGGDSHAGDLTGLSATITEVPEPGSLAVLATGLVALFVFRKRK